MIPRFTALCPLLPANGAITAPDVFGLGQGMEQPQEASVGLSLERDAGTPTPQVLLQLCWQQVPAPKLLWTITS